MNLCSKPNRVIVMILFYGHYTGPIQYDVFCYEAGQDVAQVGANVFRYFLGSSGRHHLFGNP